MEGPPLESLASQVRRHEAADGQPPPQRTPDGGGGWFFLFGAGSFHPHSFGTSCTHADPACCVASDRVFFVLSVGSYDATGVAAVYFILAFFAPIGSPLGDRTG